MRESDDLDYRLFFDANPDGILLATSDGMVFETNRAACRILERARGELVGSNLMAYWARCGTPASSIPELAGRSGVYRARVCLLRGDGMHLPAEVSMSRYRHDDRDERIAITFRGLAVHRRSELPPDHGAELWWVVAAVSSAHAEQARDAHQHRGDAAALSVTHRPPGSPQVPHARARPTPEALRGGQRSPTSSATPQSLLGLLTPREVEVLYLLSQGQSNGQIARKLVISPGTAKLHVHRVITKLGVTDRTQAAIVALSSHIFDQAAPPRSTRATETGHGGVEENRTAVPTAYVGAAGRETWPMS